MCETPLNAWMDLESVSPTGKHPITFKLPAGEYPDNRFKPIQLPCGKCFSCRKARAYDLTVRAVFESRLYSDSSFITLTVSDDKLFEIFPHGVYHRPWQLFAKRLRKRIGPFRFLMCAEYGSTTCRPHYHAVIFGHVFHDAVDLPDGSYCPSRVLQLCWPFGHVQVSDLNENRVAYVAGYTLKDYQLGRDRDWYAARGLNLPYVRWSRRPGLGLAYYQKFFRNLIRSNYEIKDGESWKKYHFEFILNRHVAWFHSRYFSDKLHLLAPELFDKIHASNEIWLLAQSDLERELKQAELLRKSACALYRVRQKERDIE